MLEARLIDDGTAVNHYYKEGGAAMRYFIPL
jgi:hypothetical protein